MRDLTDNEILRGVRNGDGSAFLVLFDRYYPAVEQYAMRLLQDPELARQAASDAFLQVFREAKRRRRPTINCPAHLFLCCRRRIISALSRRVLTAMEPWPALPSEDDDLPIPDELPLSIIISQERDAIVNDALESLSFEDREILHLAFEPLLEREDIGVILKQPLANALTIRLNRALRRLGMAVLQSGYGAQDLVGKWRNGVKDMARP